MKRWLLLRFLPMWAKETVLRDNRRLTAEIEKLRQENALLRSYIRGVRFGLRRRKEEKTDADS